MQRRAATPRPRAPDRRRPAAPVPSLPRPARILAAGLLAIVTWPAAAGGQETAPRNEDAGLPAQGSVRLQAAPILQTWHREFTTGGGDVPLARDLDGPLLEQVHPGPGAVLQGLNADAGALGFAPIAPGEASVGELRVRELHADMRTVALQVEAGLLDRVAADLMVPLVRTEVQPFFAFDPAGATLGGAAAALDQPTAFFAAVSQARSQLESRIESGDLSAQREAEARALLESSGAFASALQARVAQNSLLPLGGTGAGSQIETFYGSLSAGFASFGLGLPPFSLPETGDPAFLDGFFLGTLAADRLGTSVRGWLAGETEMGLKLALVQGYDPDDGGLDLRTTVGIRLRLPFRSANAVAFHDPTDLLGLPLGDGQRDVEVSLYQDARLGGWLEVGATLRYGVQMSDRLTMTVRSPDRPLALPDRRVAVERDPGDYLRARLAPRVRLNPFLAFGLEYRYWHKGRDRFSAGDGVDASALELQTEETRHRFGVGASYRPAPSGEEEPSASVPELGFVYQTAVAGSGGETPAAGLVSFHVRVPVEVF